VILILCCYRLSRNVLNHQKTKGIGYVQTKEMFGSKTSEVEMSGWGKRPSPTKVLFGVREVNINKTYAFQLISLT